MMNTYMKCPDCGQELAEVSVTGFDKSRRCSNCGGFFLEGWVANRVADGQMKDLPQVQADVSKFKGKSNTCPADGSPLFGYSGEEMPPDAAALKCSHCGQWWFPLDALFKFKKAYEAKNNYAKYWHRRSPITMMAFPVLMLALFTVTLGIVVNNVGRSQQVETQASVGAADFTAIYKGGGMENVSFRLDKNPGIVLYKRMQDDTWGPAELEIMGNGWYLARLMHIDQTSVYEIRIADKKYYFKAK